MSDLLAALEDVSRSPVLLVAADYDGTLAPIVADPEKAQPVRESIVALNALAALPQTYVGVVSGRSIADLSQRMREVSGARLVGSHGSEFEADFLDPLPTEKRELLQRTIDTAQAIADRTPGTMLEKKPASVAFHYRNADDQAGAAAAHELLGAVDGNPDLHVLSGKKVIEISVLRTDKGKAVERLRQRLGATAVLFIGDDVTDEDAFATLGGPDVGMKVGAGDSTAKFRVADALEVAHHLAELAERRANWLAGSEAVPIEKHSLLSDQRTCALINPEGRVAWLCLPRLDSPALFADLLGGPVGGYFDVRPAVETESPKQSYVDSSFILETDWTDGGGFKVLDYLDCSGGRFFQRAGRTDLIRVIEGQGRVRLTFAPRLDFGDVETKLRAHNNGLEIEGAVDSCVLYSPKVRWTLNEEAKNVIAVAEMDLGREPLVLELRYGTANLEPARLSEKQRREQTLRFWNSWAATLTLPSVQPQLVLRSALTLWALVYGPTGAIAAAATTSLPECAGGVRNWDYRFCWPRDAAMAASALVRLDAAGAGMKLLDWFLGLLDGTTPGTLIRPVYTLSGGHLGAEGVISALTGYRGSRPVRVGNSAAYQVQLDVLGPIADLLALKASQGAALTPEHWRLTESMVAAVAGRWTEADHGIWELRSSRKHHVHSKVMCWHTVNCALCVAEYLGRRREAWKELRKTIAADVLEHGWNPRRNAFCEAYGGNQIDAASLWVGLSGLLPAGDPRFQATVEAVEKELREGPTVYRYRYDDGLPGMEGGFNICTSWLIESYALLGRWKDAEDLFTQYISLAGPTGLMAEEYDPRRRQALGNFPQAYSHIGLINAALRLSGPRDVAP